MCLFRGTKRCGRLTCRNQALRGRKQEAVGFSFRGKSLAGPLFGLLFLPASRLSREPKRTVAGHDTARCPAGYVLQPNRPDHGEAAGTAEWFRAGCCGAVEMGARTKGLGASGRALVDGVVGVGGPASDPCRSFGSRGHRAQPDAAGAGVSGFGDPSLAVRPVRAVSGQPAAGADGGGLAGHGRRVPERLEPVLRRARFACGVPDRERLRQGQRRAIDLAVYAGSLGVPSFQSGRWTVCFLWARELWRSDWAGLLAAALWCFEPNVLAHGELITTDCAAASLGLGAGYFFWRWLREPGWNRAFLAGLFLGLAELTKATWILLFGLWPLLWAVWRWREGRLLRAPSAESQTRGSGSAAAALCSLLPAGTDGSGVDGPRVVQPRTRSFLQLAFIVLLGVFLINVCYGFGGTFAKLGDFTFV
ncbi:MAG TPA: phospholipid carrier-dependent glycosyltransferase, partial [Planctomycetaceae bacterium]|nr:phospholipid carrier-dependent glycosyltransferase [Planctomycetaceae bacterium]